MYAFPTLASGVQVSVHVGFVGAIPERMAQTVRSRKALCLKKDRLRVNSTQTDKESSAHLGFLRTGRSLRNVRSFRIVLVAS